MKISQHSPFALQQMQNATGYMNKQIGRYGDGLSVNLVNQRKEFFYVTLDEIKEVISTEFKGDVRYTETAAAQHYYESKAIRNEKEA